MQHLWLLEIILLMIGFYLLNIALSYLLRKRKVLLNTMLMPGRVLLGVLLISFCLQVINKQTPLFDLTSYIISLRYLGVILCLTWWSFKWKEVVLKVLSKKLSRTDIPLSSPFIDISKKVINIVILYISILIVLPIFKIDIIPFITFGGIGAAAIGFAEKGILANYINGFTLHVTRPFLRGDLIRIADKKIERYVEEIGWCLTSVRDLEQNPIFIPNALFSSALVVNLSNKQR